MSGFRSLGSKRTAGSLRTARALRKQAWENLVQLTAGGRWSSELPGSVQRNLRAFFFDGIFAAASDAINITYFTLFVLALGATNAQIGLLSALAGLSATLMLLPGALVTERVGQRKPVVVWSGGGISRLGLLLLAVLPFLAGGPLVVYLAIAINVLQAGFANFALPAWVSLTADIVPLAWRGRYFGTRNLLMGVVNMIVTLGAGLVITRIGGALGYQVALGIAFIIGMAATYSYAQIKEPPVVAPRSAARISLNSIGLILRGDKNFRMLFLYTIIWNLSLTVAGPFFNVHLVQTLHASATMVGFLSIVSSLAGLPAMRVFGILSDRWGPRRVQLLTGFLIPVVPLAWLLVRSPWQVIPINLLGGFLWAGFGLASFNFSLNLYPPNQREIYSALLQIAVAISGAIGAALGGLFVTLWGFLAVFAISGLGRFIASTIFARFVQETPLSGQPAPAPQPVSNKPSIAAEADTPDELA